MKSERDRKAGFADAFRKRLQINLRCPDAERFNRNNPVLLPRVASISQNFEDQLASRGGRSLLVFSSILPLLTQSRKRLANSRRTAGTVGSGSLFSITKASWRTHVLMPSLCSVGLYHRGMRA